ncbi:hypothetical protein COT48_02245 [Candidatus Woesearchaeota archaeon CG08_land_8_20_14_0_20_47_9]|nr:MAG: hypothetical protein AUJ69_00745 [Candidatus Woesearchaeota archaeon CG1_02_47_18]PIN73008.1 MAG: hypothetical protein COV22_01685 [Candidatus Woesearchaeota archaeon CG10_big_fil_rev_8_21_14_0_10_47_5]PIO04081.1 MAG: hypothetical protein COT48_02245 [Candidatus Woesearchaeota archaeon CG08_land_8_20_14_0_20_47_9]
MLEGSDFPDDLRQKTLNAEGKFKAECIQSFLLDAHCRDTLEQGLQVRYGWLRFRDFQMGS